jgi:hypothetical protein
MNRITPELLRERWRQSLGEMPEVDKLCQLSSLNEIPDAVIVVARRLSPKRRIKSFLSAYLQEAAEDKWLSWFIDDVVHGQIAAQDWERNRFLVPAVSFADQVILPRGRLLACVGENPELRIVPTFSAWKSSVSWVGAPLLFDNNADYRNPRPVGSIDLKSPQTEPIGDFDITVRRWIAARIAGVTKKKLGMDFTDAANVAAEYAPLSAWTHDATLALRGLVRESQMYRDEHPLPPGFRGPDEWFRG